MLVLAEILIVSVLVLINGFFSMSELAVLSSRKAQLQRHSESDSKEADTVRHFLKHSSQFMATTQIVLTLVGILIGVFSGATLAEQLARFLQELSVPAPFSQSLAVGFVVLGITCLTLIFGELVPKQLALNAPEKIALFVARPVKMLTTLTAPLVHLLSKVTHLVLKMMGSKPHQENSTELEDLRHMLQEGKEAGHVSEHTHQLMERSLDLEDVDIKTLMTPRKDFICLDLSDPAESHRQIISGHFYSCYPVCKDHSEQIYGVVYLKDLLPILLNADAYQLSELICEPLYLPDSMSLTQALQAFRQHRQAEALIVNQQRQVQGLLHLSDLILALSKPSQSESANPNSAA